MKPNIHYTQFDQTINPVFPYQVIDVGLTDAGCNTCQKLVTDAVLKTGHSLGEHLRFASSLVAYDFISFNANQRRHIAQFAQFPRHRVSDEMTIRENLKISVRVMRENLQQLWMHKGFATKNAKKAVSQLLGFINYPIDRFD